jgi:hypothetical protein
VKNFAKLVLLFSISFLVIFLISTVFRFLALRVDWAKNLPAKPETTITLMIAAAHWALSLALFASILFALSYTVRRNYSGFMSVIILMILSFAFLFGFSAILNNWKAVPPSQTSSIPLGEKGLILARNNTSIILLNGTAEPLGPRVISIPGQPLTYHPYAGSDSSLPPVPFGDDTPWFLKSLAIDLKLNADMLQKHYAEGIGTFLIYAGSLIFFLCSFGCAIKFSAWPLANFFIGILAFRGILAMRIFLNSPDIQEIMGSFLKEALPASLAVPLISLVLGTLLHLYSILIYLSKRRRDDDF